MITQGQFTITDLYDGEPSLSTMLLNDGQAIACTSSRTATAASTITVPFVAYLGTSRVSATASVGTLPTGVTINSITADSVIFKVASGANLGGTTSAFDTVDIVITISASGQSTDRIFNISKAISGATARTFYVEPSVSVLVKNPEGNFLNSDLTFFSYYKDGANASKVAYSRYWRIETTMDGVTWTTLATQITTSTTYTVSTIPTNIVGIRATTYSTTALTTAVAHDTQSVMVISDGIPGEPGPQGPIGVGVSSIVENYLATASASGVTTGTAGWSTTVQTVTAAKKYLWNYEIVKYTNGSSSMTAPVIVGTYGDKGEKGEEGKGISSITEYYLASDANTGILTTTTGWTTTVQTTTDVKRFLWNYEKVTYTDGTTLTVAPIVIGTHGERGPKGDDGTHGVSVTGVIEYYLVNAVASGITRTTAGWSTTMQTMTTTNKFLWNYEQTNYSNGTSTYTNPIIMGVYGTTGATGATGRAVVGIAERYLATSLPSGITRSTAGWTAAVQLTTPANKYLWNYEIITWSSGTITTYVEPVLIGVHGEAGPKGDAGSTGERGPSGLQGIQGPNGSQGIQGPQGPNGLPSYTHIAYATGTAGQNFSTAHFASATYLGMYVDSTAADSTVYTKYVWSLIKGADGSQGIPGTKGTDGKTSYLHIAYATNATGSTGFSTTDSTNKTYIGTYTDFTATDSTVYTSYTWSKFEGPTGPQGPTGETGPTGLQGIKGIQGATGTQGVKGATGANGVSSYTHIAYSTSATGATGFSVSDHVGKTYIGIYVDTIASDSASPAAYAWSLIKGADGSQGIQGPKGTDGQTPYFHTAWSTSATGATGFSTTVSTDKTYIGTYTDFVAADSATPSKYTWVLIKGEDGATGPQGPKGATGATGPTGLQGIQGIQGPTGATGVKGATGANGVSSYTHIAYSTSPTGATGFSVSDHVNKTYIGIYVDTVAADSTTPSMYAWSLIKGADGTQGIQGPKGTDGQTPYFHTAWSTSSTGATGFSTTVSDGKTYIGTYTDFVAADSSTPSKYSWALIKGADGSTGPQGPKGATGPTGATGIQGPQGPTGTSQYVHIRYSAASNGNPMTTVPGTTTAYIGIANTTSTTAPTGYASYSWSLIKGPQGNTGIQGAPGGNGTTTYTWVKYADTETGSGLSDTASGKRYIGLAFNKTTATESATASQYVWSPLYDNVVVGGRNLLQNSTFNKGFTGSYVVLLPPEIDKPLSAVVQLEYTGTAALASAIYFPDRMYMEPKAGDTLTFSFDFYCDDLVVFGGSTLATFRRYDTSTGGTATAIVSPTMASTIGTPVNSKWIRLVQTYTFTAATAIPGWFGFGLYASSTTANPQMKYKYREIKVERGNVATDWTPAPEDIQGSLDDKAPISDIDELGKLISSVSTLVNSAAGMGEFQAMKEAFDARVDLDIQDKEQLSQDLATIEGRTALVETIAGDTKLVTEFIETVISQSEEGIFIANGSKSTGILIGTDRVSFMDSGVEVAYISNQTMQINHGIFVETATIANFKFELIPGTTILAITWVGD